MWQVSSEKAPHLTLCYLDDNGDSEKRQRMIDFVTHASNTSIKRFHLVVDRRGKLGDKDADVLFFRDDASVKMVADFRSSLLANREIYDAYNAVDQYETWTPHLTLGYPTSPAKEDKRESPGIDWVYFDRIAFWDGDYNGPTIDLKSSWEVSMNDTMERSYKSIPKNDSLDDVLEHYGVRGMKWGVRKSETAGAGDPPSSDVSRARATAAQIHANKGRTDSISNKDMEHLLNRMNLDQRYSKMMSDKAAASRANSQTKKILDGLKTLKELDRAAGGAGSKAIAKAIAKALAKRATGR